MTGTFIYKTEEFSAAIYPAGSYAQIDWTEEPCALGEHFAVCNYKPGIATVKPLVAISQSVDGNYVLRLTETKRYTLKLSSKNAGEDLSQFFPRFQNEKSNKFLKIEKDKDSVNFQFINYLGRTKITFGENSALAFALEIVPDKMHYEDDYIKLTESIAQSCSELLLEYSGATSNLFSQGESSAQSLLEQFIFLRQFCYGENLQSLFEAIKRNPSRELVYEESFKPFGMGMPSKQFFTQPFSHSRGWNLFNGSYLPEAVAVTQKYDSLDTPANRFIKFALQKFNEICSELSEILSDNGSGAEQSECLLEVRHIKEITDDILRDSFFDDVGELDKIPENNQILIQREGYAQIFSAASMIDLALQLDWRGKDEVFAGESKNVALLYEYYLFFELYKVVRSVETDCRPMEVCECPFVAVKENAITISLQQDKKSCQSFELKRLGTKVNLYYNRTFSSKEFSTTKYEGSYSRPFRPDYTLAVFPLYCVGGGFNGEGEATEKGLVSFIHFDAKYRITDLTAFIGKAVSEEAEVQEDKADSVMNTYRRGDLLKMHTYNDAIRRTVGSYVLYPGSENETPEKQTFRLYEEILPGVGAFAVKPSIQEQSEGELKSFIMQLIEVKSKSYTRLSRMAYYVNEVLQEPTVDASASLNTVPELGSAREKYILGYLRADKPDDYYFHLREHGFLQSGREFIFYYYAIKDDYVYSHHKDIARINRFRFYTNKISESAAYKIEPILCEVLSSELVSKETLERGLREELGFASTRTHGADFYYALRIKVIDENASRLTLSIRDVDSQNGNDTFSPHSPKVIDV